MIELRNRATIAAACGTCGWSNGDRLELVDRYALDYPPIPHFSVDAFIEVYRDSGGDPDDRVHECPECGDPLDRHACVERVIPQLGCALCGTMAKPATCTRPFCDPGARRAGQPDIPANEETPDA